MNHMINSHIKGASRNQTKKKPPLSKADFTLELETMSDIQKQIILYVGYQLDKGVNPIIDSFHRSSRGALIKKGYLEIGFNNRAALTKNGLRLCDTLRSV